MVGLCEPCVHHVGWSEMCSTNIGDDLNLSNMVVQRLYCTLYVIMAWIRPLSDQGMKMNSPKAIRMGWTGTKGIGGVEVLGEEVTCRFIQARDCEGQKRSSTRDQPL